MNTYLPQGPVGMEALASAVNEICSGKGGCRPVSPVHFIIQLDAGNGQTTATRYISDSLYASRALRFGGLDRFIEFKLDGTLGQMKKIFCRNIPEHAVYTNSFEGVISFDITALSSHSNEMQTEYFIAELRKMSPFSSMVFYIGSSPSSGLLKIAGRIQEAVPKTVMIHNPHYSADDFARIIEKGLELRDIQIESTAAFHQAMCEIVKARQVSTVKDSLEITEHAVVAADYSGRIPILWTSTLQETFPDCFGKEKSKV